MLEYALLVALSALMVIAGAKGVGVGVDGSFEKMANQMPSDGGMQNLNANRAVQYSLDAWKSR